MMNNTLTHYERELNEDETREILSLSSDDVTATLFSKYFARKIDGSIKFYTNDYFRLPIDRFNTKKEVYTTIGIYIANIFLIQPRFSHLFGYINKPFTGKVIESIDDVIADALYNDKITTDDMADHYNRMQWIGGNRIVSIISPSITPALLKEPEDIIKRRDELFELHKDELTDDNPGNAIAASKIEKELIGMAEKYIKTQDGSENFDSKSKNNVSNHYKNMNVMKGPIRNSYTGTYKVNKSNYNSGIDKREYASFADASVLGSYGRAVNTEKGGYMAKESNQGLNAVSASPKGSDCRTTRTLRVFLYPQHKSEYLNRYIIDNGLLVELTKEVFPKYENTFVDMRSPMYCLEKEPHYCNICLGNQPYLLGLENFGLAISRIPNKLLTISMKSFHDSTLKSKEIPVDELFELQ